MCTDLCGCSDTDKDCENKSVDANDDGCNFKDDDNDVYDDENEYEFISVSLRENFLRTQLKTNFCNLLAIRRSFIRGRMSMRLYQIVKKRQTKRCFSGWVTGY